MLYFYVAGPNHWFVVPGVAVALSSLFRPCMLFGHFVAGPNQRFCGPRVSSGASFSRYAPGMTCPCSGLSFVLYRPWSIRPLLCQVYLVCPAISVNLFSIGTAYNIAQVLLHSPKFPFILPLVPSLVLPRRVSHPTLLAKHCSPVPSTCTFRRALCTCSVNSSLASSFYPRIALLLRQLSPCIQLVTAHCAFVPSARASHTALRS